MKMLKAAAIGAKMSLSMLRYEGGSKSVSTTRPKPATDTTAMAE